MSDTDQSQPNAGLLQHLKIQMQGFIHQRDAAKQQFEQLQGAIYASEQIIEKIENDAKEFLVNLAKKLELEKLEALERCGIEEGKNEEAC